MYNQFDSIGIIAITMLNIATNTTAQNPNCQSTAINPLPLVATRWSTSDFKRNRKIVPTPELAAVK